MAAVRQNRIMTIKQETVGTKKDFGIVGFREEKDVSYLIFPKRLTLFKGLRIIGIRYDQVKISGPIGRLIQSASQVESPRSKRVRKTEAADTSQRKKLKRFQVTLRFTGTADVSQEIDAATKTEAREKAAQVVMPNLSRATVTRKVMKVELMR